MLLHVHLIVRHFAFEKFIDRPLQVEQGEAQNCEISFLLVTTFYIADVFNESLQDSETKKKKQESEKTSTTRSRTENTRGGKIKL